MHIKLLIHLHRFSDDLWNQLSQILVKVLYQLAEENSQEQSPKLSSENAMFLHAE